MLSHENQYSIEIIGIEQNGRSVKILSPMDGDNPIPIKKGTRLAIHERLKGDTPRSHIVVAGPDPNKPNQPYQYFDDETEKWILIVQQPESHPINVRSSIRVMAVFDVTLTVVESNKKYQVRSKDISPTGILLSTDSDLEISRGSEVILDFELPNSSYELPLITGKVVRIVDRKDSDFLPKCYDLGIEFDEFQNPNDQDEIEHFVINTENSAELF